MSASPAAAYPAPDHKTVSTRRFSCDGGEGALGHPRVWLTIPHDTGAIDCPYCDTRFTLAEGAHDAH